MPTPRGEHLKDFVERQAPDTAYAGRTGPAPIVKPHRPAGLHQERPAVPKKHLYNPAEPCRSLKLPEQMFQCRPIRWMPPPTAPRFIPTDVRNVRRSVGMNRVLLADLGSCLCTVCTTHMYGIGQGQLSEVCPKPHAVHTVLAEPCDAATKHLLHGEAVSSIGLVW